MKERLYIMKYVKLHNTSLELSRVCLGAGSFGTGLDERESFEILDAFTAAGGNFADTANIYGKWAEDKLNHSEKVIGKWLKSRNAYDKITIATKCAHFDLDTPDISRVTERAIREDIEESLQTLGIGCIDFCWLHRDDESVPIGEIIGIMERLVSESKINYYGASNYKLARMKAARAHCEKNNCRGFSAVSNRWSLAAVNPEAQAGADPSLAEMTAEFYSWHTETKTPAIPYSATASGFFEKLYNANPQIKNGELLTPCGELGLAEHIIRLYINEDNLRIYEELSELKSKYGASLYTLSLARLVNNRDFDVIPISSVRNTVQLSGFLQAGEIDLD